MQVLKYKGYVGTAEIDMEGGVIRGKVMFARDLVTYQSDSVNQIQAEFEAAVDDYIQTCEELGREPERSFSGQFNVRIPPENHRRASIRAAEEGTNLNDLVCKAVAAYLDGPVAHSLNVTIQRELVSTTIQSSTGGIPSFTTMVAGPRSSSDACH